MEQNSIYVKKIIHQTMADGPGLRVSVYCSGCYHKCKGCHNPQTWDMFSGELTSIDTILNEIKEDTYSSGVTFTGGDPMYQVETFTELAKRIKEETDKDIWLYTGFVMSKILNEPRLSQILKYVDYVVDGPYVEDLRDTDLKFRGSSNQTIYKIVDRFPILDYEFMCSKY